MIKMGSIKFTNTNKLAEDLSRHISEGMVSFALPVQRGYVWDRAKKSAFILNMIEGGPTFPVYVNIVNQIHFVIDGQQRGRTTNSYIDNKFSLAQLPSVQRSNGETVDISGKKFVELPQDFQDAILRYNFEYNFGENLTEEQVKTVFIRLNSGKPLSTTEMTKAQIKSVTEVMYLAQHSAFKKIINDKGIEASKNASLVMQTYVALFETNKCMLSKAIKVALGETQISEEQKEHIKECLDIFEQTYEVFVCEKTDISKKLTAIFKRKSHFIAFMYTISNAIKASEFDINVLIKWCKHFFDCEVDQTTICNEYNLCLKESMNSNESVTTRLVSMYEDYQKFIETAKETAYE